MTILTWLIFISSAFAVDGFTHKIKNVDKNIFQISLDKTAKRNCPILNYKLVISAKVCEGEKAQFFDSGDINEHEFYLFCYPTNARRSIKITFVAGAGPLTVESLNSKMDSKMQIGDVLRSVDGKAVTSFADLKMVLANLTEKRTSVAIDVLRNSKNIKITEPVAMSKKMNISIFDGSTAKQDSKVGWCK